MRNQTSINKYGTLCLRCPWFPDITLPSACTNWSVVTYPIESVFAWFVMYGKTKTAGLVIHVMYKWVKGMSFYRNCGAASVGEWYTKIWFINGVDNVNWPPYRDWKADVSSDSPSSERNFRSDEGLMLRKRQLFNLCTVVNLHYQLRW